MSDKFGKVFSVVPDAHPNKQAALVDLVGDRGRSVNQLVAVGRCLFKINEHLILNGQVFDNQTRVCQYRVFMRH